MKAKKTKFNKSPEWKPKFISEREVATISQGVQVVDTYEAQLRELFAIDNPKLFHSDGFEKAWRKYLADTVALKPLREAGAWVFYAWSNTAVHILSEGEFSRVRTARNRNLITEEEQNKFYNAVVGIAGLSIGASVALAIALSGGAKRMKLADPDTIELSNLNRIPVGIGNLGLPKAVVVSRLIYEINPYAEVEIFPEGITTENIEDFFGGNNPLTIAVDEMDNLSAKEKLRVMATKKRIPVIMSADCDTNSVIDVERYDLDPKTEHFHGRLGKYTAKSLAGLSKRETGMLIGKHIGAENHTERMNQSLSAIGRELVSWPQLGGTALQNGTAVAYIIRQIATGQKVTGGRAVIALSKILSGENYTNDC